MVWGCFPLKKNWDPTKYQETLDKNLAVLCQEITAGSWLDIPIGQLLKRDTQTHTKRILLLQIQPSIMAIPVPWPKPYWKPLKKLLSWRIWGILYWAVSLSSLCSLQFLRQYWKRLGLCYHRKGAQTIVKLLYSYSIFECMYT